MFFSKLFPNDHQSNSIPNRNILRQGPFVCAVASLMLRLSVQINVMTKKICVQCTKVYGTPQ